MLRSAFPMIPDGGDYFYDAGGAIDALVRLDFHGFVVGQPLMGSLSLFLRAPFVALVFHQSLPVVYLVGSLPCLAAAVALGMVLRRRMARAGLPALAGTAVAAAVVLNPGVIRALNWGHPEEVLAAALCVGALLAALDGRAVAAGLLLGCALATKQWAAIAVVPLLIALPARQGRALAIAAGVALAFTLPALLGSLDGFVTINAAAANARPVVTAPNVWWLVATHPGGHPPAGAGNFAGTIPGWLAAPLHPALVLAGLPLGALFVRRRGRARREDVLGLFALLMLVRCAFDPWNIDYYHAPFLLALAAWEGTARGGWPRMTVLVGAALALTFPASLNSQREISAEGLRYCLTYLVWALPLLVWLASEVLGRPGRVPAALRAPAPVAAPAPAG
jgi:glycosyl transferase family 87